VIITHLSTFDYGGAGLAALRCHRRMLEFGYDSTMYVEQSRHTNSDVVGVPRPPGREEILARAKAFVRTLVRSCVPEKLLAFRRSLIRKHWLFCSRDSRYGFNSSMESVDCGLNPKLVSMIEATDVLFVHWAAGFVNSYDVRKIRENTGCKVFYWTLDMAHLTGGCHFSWGCDGYMGDCSDCPALYDNNKELASAQLKAKAMNLASIAAGCISDQSHSLTKARKSSIPFVNYTKVPVVIEDAVFRPSRTSFKTDPLDRRYLLGNANPANIRKGFSSLYQTLLILDRLLDDGKTVVLLCLDSEPFGAFRFKHIEFEEFAFRTTDEELAGIYQMADAFVCTSVADYGPSMLYEALLCGLPCVAFDEGVVEEVIENGKNGYAVDKYDATGMAHRIHEVLYVPGSITLSPAEIHETVARRFDKDAWRIKFEQLLDMDIAS